MEIIDEDDEEVKRLMLRISRKEITLCDSCDAFFDYIQRKTTCDACLHKQLQESLECSEVRGRQYEYKRRPEVKKRRREHERRPEVKSKRSKYDKERYQRLKKLREEE